MNTEPIFTSAATPEIARNGIKIIGVGTAGAAMIAGMAREHFPGATFVIANTDGTLPADTDVTVLNLETRLLRGLGTGGDPERGQKLAEEHFGRLKSACAGAEAVFILAGFGGGAGTGIAPVLARAARESGALTLAFVTLPFDLEGNRRQNLAQHGLDQLKAVADGVVCLPNQKAFKLIDENASLVETFATTSRLLVEAVQGVWRLMRHCGILDVHFDELCALLRERHAETFFATVEAAGTTRAHDAIEKLFAHPLLDGGETVRRADTLLVSLLGGPDLTMTQINHFMHRVNQDAKSAKVVMGAATDESFRDRLAVTVFALHRAKPVPARSPRTEDADRDQPGFDTELLHKETMERPASRVVPPAPSLTMEQREALVTKSAGRGSRGRKAVSKMKQGTLALDIVSRGRFDKTEATIRNGEDLDLPTFVRKGISLN